MEQIQIQKLTQEQIQAIQQTPLEIMNYKTKTLDKIVTAIYQTGKTDRSKIPMMDKEIHKYPGLMEALTTYSKIERQQAKMRRQQSEINLKRERRLLQEEMLKLTENMQENMQNGQNGKRIVNIILSKVP